MSEHITDDPYADLPDVDEDGNPVEPEEETLSVFLDPDAPDPVGILLDVDRGTLPYALIHGEALVTAAAWGMGEAGVLPGDSGVPWDEIREHVVETGATLVLHDPLCPMTPAAFIADCVDRAHRQRVVVVGVRPVTDTVKTVTDGVLGETVDREDLRQVVSPIALPSSVVAAMPNLPSTHFDVLVPLLREHFPIALVEAPAEARRIVTADDVRVLEELTRRETGPLG
ncbi:2-C-methyl-D-erythritol 4-phosphate cytidylyltransferase [Nocardioides yefusunii]|uniref:2-C-methyl-D-erythritol 4-phosphate cytidylyltransferase n=1 Tax=Nocardioides yefusunii TaxID=2500546 RepID=A0ABW1QWL0_9ACTN|nr:2-C-methyl-D-erythritol 4-phosphate cytidylyltransferase [Nocardioides yefusunii]